MALLVQMLLEARRRRERLSGGVASANTQVSNFNIADDEILQKHF